MLVPMPSSAPPTPGRPDAGTGAPSALHEERLWPGPLGWAAVVGFAVVVGVAMIPVRPAVGAAVGAAVLVAGLVLAVLSSPVVRVGDGVLRAGRATIPVGLLGPGRVLDRDGVREALGPGSDARLYACLRAWVHGAVLVEVTDPADPTPAWLVSSRRPEALLGAVRTAQGDQAAHSEQIG